MSELSRHNANYVGGDIGVGHVSMYRMVARPAPGFTGCQSRTRQSEFSTGTSESTNYRILRARRQAREAEAAEAASAM